jgi:ATP-dependent protease ClpP protease subunit/ssDNA-binding Zn-finger/Zn-ribbon topoisomerase 1
VRNVYPIRCRIRNAAADEVTRVDVYDDIGEGGWFSEGLTAKAFVAQVAGVKGPLEVHINSGGGDVFDGIAIGNALRGHAGRVTTVTDGLAASIASVIAQAGQERVIQPGAMMMIHDASGACYGDAGEMAKMTETLDAVSGNIADIYASRSGKTPGFWRDQMKAETWYTADEAVAAGLADRVGEGEALLPAGLDLAAFTSVPGRIAARLRRLPQAAAGDDDSGDDSGDDGTCPACGGLGRMKHPQTGKFTKSCPDCNGTGQAPAGDDDDDDGGGQGDDGMSGRRRRKTRNAGSDDDDGQVECPTCDGTGKILEGHRKCPDCGGTGRVSPDQADDRRRVVVVSQRRRVLGIESMPLANEALPVHHTATVDTTWDGPAAVAAMPNDATVLRYCHAWEDSAADDGTADDPDGDADDEKQSYKFPHHTGKGSPANLAACRNGLARLSNADIPDGDRPGVQKHLQAHLQDGSSDDDSAGNAMTPEQIRAALKGASE